LTVLAAARVWWAAWCFACFFGVVCAWLALVVLDAEEVQRDDDAHQHDSDQHPRWDQRAPRLALALALAPQGSDRLELVVGRTLVAPLVVIDELAGVEPEVLAIGPQEALDVHVAGEQSPFLVLDRAEVLGADLRARLDLVDVDLGAHPRLPQGGADFCHRAEGYRRDAGWLALEIAGFIDPGSGRFGGRLGLW
jgi:hypothetical protein